MTVQDIEILKQKCNAVMIALCPGQCQCKFIQCINVKPFGGRGSPPPALGELTALPQTP